MSPINPTYVATVTVTSGREGQAVSDDGGLNVQLRPPRRRGASEGTNPEQLFAAAWGACFQSAMLAAARRTGVDAADSTVTVQVALGPDAVGGYGLAAQIRVEVPGLDRATVQQLAEAAHAQCPYSRATRGNIAVEVIAGEAGVA